MEMYLIHPQIFEDNRICSTAKLLFSLICNLSIKDGVCTASNNYLGEKLSLKKERVSKLITELVKYDYLKSECKYKENNKHYFEERILTPLSLNFTIPININDYTYSIKKLYPMSFNDLGMSLNDNTNLSKTSNAVDLPIIKNDVGMSLKEGAKLNNNTPMSLNAYEILNNNNNILSKEKSVQKEKKETKKHSFEKSIYFENYELFKSDFEVNYPKIDSNFYYKKYSNNAIGKGYKYANWKSIFESWLDDLKGNYQKIEIKPEIKQTPLVRKMSLSDEKHERIHEILQGENPKEILEANYGINSVLYLSQMIDYIFPKNNYNVTEIWNRK